MIDYFIDFYVNLNYGLTGLVINNVIAAIVPFLVDKFPMKKRELIFFFLRILMCVAAMNILCSVSYALFTYIGMSQICGTVIIALYLMLFSKSPVKNKIITATAFISATEIVLLAGFSVADITMQQSIFIDKDFPKIFSFLITILMTVLLFSYVLFLRAFSPDKLSEVLFVSACCETISFAICTGFWILTNMATINAIVRLSISLMLIALSLSAYYFSFKISATVEENRRRQADKLLRKADENMLSVVENNIEELRKLRHEIENQYTYMKFLLEQKNYEQLDEYFSTYVERIPLSVFVYCDNKVVSAVLSLEIQKAEKNGIKIDYLLAVPKNISLPDCDLCSLIFNVLNNSIEYLSNKDDLEKIIRFSLTLKNKSLMLCCKNAVSEEDKENALLLKTTKADKDIHGYGSKIIKSIVKKYNGRFECAINDNYFCVTALLFEEKNDKEENL